MIHVLSCVVLLVFYLPVNNSEKLQAIAGPVVKGRKTFYLENYLGPGQHYVYIGYGYDYLYGVYRDHYDPKDCTPGRYMPYTHNYHTSCFECSAGTFNTQPAKAACYYCDFGKYQNAVGQTSCKDCGPGQWSTLGYSACEDCWPGMYQHENIAGGVCHHCVPGKYNLEYGKKLQSDCKDCDIGTYQDQNGYASTAAAAEIRSPCKNCAAGSYQDQQGQTSPLCVSFFFIFHF